MELQWRFRARVVAYIDLILSILGLVVAILYIFVGIATTIVLSDEKFQDELAKENEEEHVGITVKLFLYGLWIFGVFFTVCTAVDMWAAIMLLKATRENADPRQSMHRALIWRNVTIVFLVICIVLYGVFMSDYVSMVIEVLFRGILLFIVCKFIKEVEQVAAGGVAVFLPSTTPDTIVIKG